MKKILFLILIFGSLNISAMTLKDFKQSLNNMVNRGLISQTEATKHLLEYQFKLENGDADSVTRSISSENKKSTKEL